MVVQKKKVSNVIFNIFPFLKYQVNTLHPVKIEITVQTEFMFYFNPFLCIFRVIKQLSDIIWIITGKIFKYTGLFLIKISLLYHKKEDKIQSAALGKQQSVGSSSEKYFYKIWKNW